MSFKGLPNVVKIGEFYSHHIKFLAQLANLSKFIYKDSSLEISINDNNLICCSCAEDNCLLEEVVDCKIDLNFDTATRDSCYSGRSCVKKAMEVVVVMVALDDDLVASEVEAESEHLAVHNLELVDSSSKDIRKDGECPGALLCSYHIHCLIPRKKSTFSSAMAPRKVLIYSHFTLTGIC